MKQVAKDLTQLVVIVNMGKASKVIAEGKKAGLSGGTVLLGHGTYHDPLMHLLGLNESRKELVWMVGLRPQVDSAIEAIRQRFKLDLPRHGIAFTIPVARFVGVHQSDYYNDSIQEDAMHQAIYTIVNKGRGQEVIEAAAKAGANGGTILNARGSGTHETAKVFAVEIEPEKEIILTLVPSEKLEAIVEAIRTALDIDSPGKGVIFVLPVTKAIGLS